LDRLDGMVKAKKLEYTRSESMVELVGWLRVGTAELYVWKSWLNRLVGMVKLKKSGYTRSETMVESVGWHGQT
jgi:hypothetical protein